MGTSSPYGLFGSIPSLFGGSTASASNPNNPFNTYKPGSLGAQAASPAANVSAPSNTLPKGATALPTMAQTNSTFMKNNPQYSTGLMTPPGSASAATTQQAADMAKYFPNGIGGTTTSATPAISATQATPAAPVVPNTYTQSTQNLANTQTTPATTAAVGTSQGIANNQGTSAPGGTPGAYANTATTGLLGLTQGQTPQVQQAEQQYNTLAQQSPVLQAELAGNPNIASEVASGRGQVLGSQLAGQLQGASQNVQNALTGQGQQITAGTDAASAANTTQSQQLTGANQAGSLANTAQSNQIGAQNYAGSLTTPNQTQTALSPSQTQYYTSGPNAGQPIAGLNAPGTSGNTAYTNALQTAANSIKNGASFSTALSGMSQYGNPNAYSDLVKAMGSGFNVTANDANAATSASNIQTAGTASVNAGAQAYIQSYPQVQQLNQALNNITSLGNMTVQNANGNNVNPFAFAPANSTLASIKTNLSDAGQVTFNSNIQQLKSAIQNLYSSNGGNTPSNITQQIGQMADGSLSVAGLQALLSAAESEGSSLLTNAKNTAGAEYQASQGGGNNTSTATPSSGTTSSGISYTITQ